MHPVSNQTARVYGTAQTDKFEHLRDITEEIIKSNLYVYLQCCSSDFIFMQKVKNEYIISDTQIFFQELSSLWCLMT